MSFHYYYFHVISLGLLAEVSLSVHLRESLTDCRPLFDYYKHLRIS